MNKTTKILNIIYGLIVLLFALDCLPSFDIKNQSLKSFAYIGILLGTPAILAWNFITIKPLLKKVTSTLLLTAILIVVVVIGPMRIMFASGAWRTQTIQYQNSHSSFKKVEFQMQDVGALGYNRRTVEVIQITPLFILVDEVPPDIDQQVEWTKVGVDINELELKY